MEDNDIFHIFYHILDTKHLICQVSLKSIKAKLSKYTLNKWVFSAVRTLLRLHGYHIHRYILIFLSLWGMKNHKTVIKSISIDV